MADSETTRKSKLNWRNNFYSCPTVYEKKDTNKGKTGAEVTAKGKKEVNKSK